MAKTLIERKLADAISVAGRDVVERWLDDLIGQEGLEDEVLTIVVNSGVHHLPDSVIRGEVFILTRGMLDLSTELSANNEFSKALLKLSDKLKERAWKKVYVVPFGPNTLAMQVKLLVYRITHLETIDLLYHKENGYYEININLRKLISSEVGIQGE